MKDTPYKIEQNISIPDDLRGALNRKYPFGKMAVGDSFFVDGDVNTHRVRSAASYFSMRHPEYKFTIRTSPGERGCRVWRIDAT